MSAIRYWTEQALEANRLSHTPNALDQSGAETGPFLSARALAMTMLAMHDAYMGASGAAAFPVLPAPLAAPPAPPGLDPEHAAAAAAYAVLSALYAKPGQAGRSLNPELSAAWEQYVALHQPNRPSIVFGQAVAKAVTAWRAGDDAFRNATFLPTGLPYDHDEVPREPGQGFAGAAWGGAPAFAVPLQAFQPPFGAGPGDPFASSPDYIAEFNEVRDYGEHRSSHRTPDQTVIGTSWAYDGARRIGTPPRLYMQVVLAVLDRHAPGLPADKLLGVLASVAIAMADAGIQAWHYKYSEEHMLWRPALGIPKAPLGTALLPDPHWVPLGRPDTNGFGSEQTPNFPAYPSGHATFGASAFQVLRRFLTHNNPGLGFNALTDADAVPFAFTSDEYDGVNVDPVTRQPRPRTLRAYDGLWQAIVDNSESRIWLGVHWRMDGISTVTNGQTMHGRPNTPNELGSVGGVRLGWDIANLLANTQGY
jgi:hypothetical protein